MEHEEERATSISLTFSEFVWLRALLLGAKLTSENKTLSSRLAEKASPQGLKEAIEERINNIDSLLEKLNKAFGEQT